MAEVIRMGGESKGTNIRTIPDVLQREETAAQIVALMMARIDRPGPEEMRRILNSADQQITGLQIPGAPLS